MTDYTVLYSHPKCKSLGRLTVQAESLSDARVLAKYRVEVATNREFTIVSVKGARNA